MHKIPIMYKVVDDFEKAIARYTGAKYACAVNSCTNALLLACAYNFQESQPDPLGRMSLDRDWEVTIPKNTYVGVPMSIIHAGGTVKFEEDNWIGSYQLKPYPIFDSALSLRSGIYKDYYDKGTFVCISLHWGKTLNLGQGGVILHDNKKAQEWFKKARFDGRTMGVEPKKDKFIMGWHCYMSPRDAADALTRLHFLPKHNEPLPNDDYPDLSKLDIFKED